MRETDQILNLWAECERAREAAVLATVVRTRGSSYRVPGARLLITANGRRAGSISGGCLEDDLIKKAWWLTEENRRPIRRYDTNSDGDLLPAYGLGCNGVIDILVERLTPGDANILQLLETVRLTRRAVVVAHLLQPSALVGKRLYFAPDRQIHREIESDQLACQLEAGAVAALDERLSAHVSLSQDGEFAEAFLEVLAPPPRLLVFGAGDDAIPVTELAHYLGWNVSVFDGRAHYAKPERFPKADEVRHGPPEQSNPQVDAWTAAVLMSHSYSQDLSALRVLAQERTARAPGTFCATSNQEPLRYLGILGPRKRTERLLADAGLDVDSLMAPPHSPMGLDIGADGPQQVALSVIAEIQASLNGRLGGPLRERVGPIHSRVEDDSAKFTVHSIVCA